MPCITNKEAQYAYNKGKRVLAAEHLGTELFVSATDIISDVEEHPRLLDRLAKDLKRVSKRVEMHKEDFPGQWT